MDHRPLSGLEGCGHPRAEAVERALARTYKPPRCLPRLDRPDGSTRDARLPWQAASDKACNPAESVEAARDFAGRRTLEERVRRVQRAAAPIGNFAAEIAHNFNNLLAIVILNLELLRERMPQDGEQALLSLDALEAARRGADLTRRVLALARRQPLQPCPTDINRLVESVVRLLRATLGGGVAVVLELGDGLWPVVVDPTQLEAGLINLVTNSRHAMPGGGRLTITTGNRRLNDDRPARPAQLPAGDYVFVEVGDTGTGIPPELLDRIFDPFFTTKGEGRGTGLGLTTVSGFAERSGGYLEVHSTVGIGTTFRLYLPRADTGIAAAASRRDVAAEG